MIISTTLVIAFAIASGEVVLTPLHLRVYVVLTKGVTVVEPFLVSAGIVTISVGVELVIPQLWTSAISVFQERVEDLFLNIEDGVATNELIAALFNSQIDPFHLDIVESQVASGVIVGRIS